MTYHGSKADKIECRECNITFGTASELRQHMVDSHKDKTKGWSIICSECGDGFMDVAAFANHQKKVHGLQTDFECPECGATFARKPNLEKHKNTYHSKEGAKELPKCKQCHKTFPTLALLRLHRRDVHGLKDVKCAFCGETFSTVRAYKRHLQDHH